MPLLSEMFFINHGECQVILKQKSQEIPGFGEEISEEYKVLAKFSRGDFFGEVALLTPNIRRTATVTASSNCDLSVLDLDDFQVRYTQCE